VKTNIVSTALQSVVEAPEAAMSTPVASTVEATSEWLASFTAFVDKIDGIVWGLPLISSILVTGLLLTCVLRFLPLFNLKHAFKCMFHQEEGAGGEVSQFGALCTALSATIGTGNIVGVATAIGTGGPGALFWMEVAAFFGMATKYAEGLLAVKYREILPDGTVLGGPFYYIEKGLAGRFGLRNWKWLATIFAVFGIGAGIMGIGTITQIHGITSAVQRFFDPLNIFIKRTKDCNQILYSIRVDDSFHRHTHPIVHSEYSISPDSFCVNRKVLIWR
jgi:Na+/alanine symporter